MFDKTRIIIKFKMKNHEFFFEIILLAILAAIGHHFMHNSKHLLFKSLLFFLLWFIFFFSLFFGGGGVSEHIETFSWRFVALGLYKNSYYYSSLLLLFPFFLCREGMWLRACLVTGTGTCVMTWRHLQMLPYLPLRLLKPSTRILDRNVHQYHLHHSIDCLVIWYKRKRMLNVRHYLPTEFGPIILI